MTAPALRESDIQRTCCEFLECDGWRRIRLEQNFSERKRKTIGEAGMADDLFIRYMCIPIRDPVDIARVICNAGAPNAEVLFIEWKRLMPVKRGKTWGRATKASNQQKAWHARERNLGALTLIAGENFTATIDGFQAWYRTSGLQRRRG